MQPHHEYFLTRQYEMGTDRKLRIQCLCNYMEEAAGVHADRLGAGLSRLREDGLVWVLAKMRLRVTALPGFGRTVQVATWPVSMERVQFRRDFILTDEDGEVLATAVTQWVVMGVATRRLARFPYYIEDMQPSDPPLAQESGDIRIPALDGDAPAGPVFPVRLADIDQNRHVNNGRYVDFVLEAAEDAGGGGALQQLDVIFRAEGLRGDVIGSRTQPEPEAPRSLLHSLFRVGDGQELARARTIVAG